MNVFNNLATDVLPNDFVQVGEGERKNRVRYGDVLFTASSESAEEVGMASGVTLEPPGPLYLNSFGFRPETGELDPEFAKHLFRSAEVRRQIIRTANGVTRFNISKQRFRAIKIPVPPLRVQREVATVLDRLAGLEGELEARRRQYAHYRDSLLNFADGRTRSIPLAELAAIGTGSRNTNEAIEGGKYPFFVRSQAPLAIDDHEFDETAIITAGDGWALARCSISLRASIHCTNGRIAST